MYDTLIMVICLQISIFNHKPIVICYLTILVIFAIISARFKFYITSFALMLMLSIILQVIIIINKHSYILANIRKYFRT